MRLIDADKLPYEDIECTDGRTYMVVNAYDLDNAPTVPAIPIDRIKELRKEIDHSLDYYYAHSRIAPYTAIQSVLERIDKMLREVKE